MPKNDFDRDFDFEKESDFDPKAFLGAEDYDADIDLSEFTDEELGLHEEKPAKAEQPEAKPADSSFDDGEDLDLDDFLNMGLEEESAADYDDEVSGEEVYEEEIPFPEEAAEEEPEEEEQDFPDVMIFPKAKTREEYPVPEAEEYPAQEEEEAGFLPEEEEAAETEVVEQDIMRMLRDLM